MAQSANRCKDGLAGKITRDAEQKTVMHDTIAKFEK